jgi:type VI secretion system protein ImpC
MASHMDFELNLGGETTGMRREEQPFNLLILGNFSGNKGQETGGGQGEIASRRIVKVDLDNIDDLWSVFNPALTMETASDPIEIEAAELDDLHPDALFRSLPVFAELRSMRSKLLDPASAQSALDSILSTRTAIEGELVNDPPPAADGDGGGKADDMFERLLGKPGGQASSSKRVASDLDKLDKFIERLVAPHIVYETDPRVDTAVDSVDLATAELMRRILHQPDFQTLEASWRSLHDLVSEIELDEDLQLYVCDISREDLLNALPEPGSGLQDSDLFRLLVERRRQAADDTPWSLILGDYYFGPDAEDIAILTALGAMAAVNGAVFIGGARPDVLGCSSSAELADAKYWTNEGQDFSLWHSLRASAVADRIGLAMPRVLSRLPYGRDTEEIDTFFFEEMPSRNHEHYLWSNPAYACGRLLAENFTREGWRMEPGDHVDLGALPAHNYSEDGETKLQPCAEILLSESTMVAMLDQGLMPVVSYRNQNTAVLGRFQSIASPLKRLAGPWT